jgi:hypothetical protein
VGVEALERRELLSRDLPLPKFVPNVRTVVADRSVYQIRVDGPGVVKVRPAGRGLSGIDVFGTTGASTLVVDRIRVGPHAAASGLPVGRIDVKSGALGAIQASSADLLGPVTGLPGSIDQIAFRLIGPNAVIDVGGDLGTLAAGAIDLGPEGRITVGGAVPGGIGVVGALDLAGGSILVEGGGIGAVSARSASILDGGRIGAVGPIGSFTVATDLVLDTGGSLGTGATLGRLGAGRDLNVGASSRIDVGTDLTGILSAGRDLNLVGGPILVQGNLTGGIAVGRDATARAGGLLAVLRDVTGPVGIGDDLALDGGSWIVGRDLAGGLAVSGDVRLARGGLLAVGRDIPNGLMVQGNIDTSQGGFVRVGGNLNGLTVDGWIQGRGGDGVGPSDIMVGLNLNGLTVRGAIPNQGSINRADLDIGKNLIGLDIRHGVFMSTITAGVLIDGAPVPEGGSIGPDGPVAVYNSTILSGMQIRSLILNGDVVSDLPANTAGRPTRIVAGLNRAGQYAVGGSIENLLIAGSLIDAVVAASVAPAGGDGRTITLSCPPGVVGTYDAPAGTIAGGAVGDVVLIEHGSPATFDEFGQLVGFAYDPIRSPNPDDCILPGSINAGLAPTPIPVGSPDGTAIPLPSRLTVTGGVINTTAPGSGFDQAGLFAADTRGVQLGVARVMRR